MTREQVLKFANWLHYTSRQEREQIITQYINHHEELGTVDDHYDSLWDNLFHNELQKIFEAIEHAVYHALFQDLKECYERLGKMTEMRNNFSIS
jgi:hypothetical protein